MIVYPLLVFAVWVLSTLRFQDRRLQGALLMWVALALVLFAGLRGEVDRDYAVYVGAYYESSAPLGDYLTGRRGFTNEPVIELIASFCKYQLGSRTTFFLLFAALGVGLKTLAIWRYSADPRLSFFAYFCLYYFLQEMTQIRAGVATGFFLLAVGALLEGRRARYLGLVCLGAMFHYSILAALPLGLLKRDSIRPGGYIALLLLAMAIAVGGGVASVVISGLPRVPLLSRVFLYLSYVEAPSLTNPFLWLRLGLAAYLLAATRRAPVHEHLVLLTKFYVLSLAVFFLCYPIAAFSIRLRELLGAVEVFLFPIVILRSRQVWFAAVAGCGVLAGNVVAYTHVIGLLRPYAIG